MSLAICKLQHLGCITALHLHPPRQPDRLLVACGSTLHVYSYPSLRLQTSHQWHHHAHRIHGVTSLGDIVAVWGGRHVQLLLLTAQSISPYSQPLRLHDHIWTAACLACPSTCSFSVPTDPTAPSTCHLILGLAHNSVAVCGVPLPSAVVARPVELRVESEVACSVRPLLYSVSFHGSCLHDLRVVAGTVFSSILVWTAHPTARITHTLTGHTGVIFHTATSDVALSSSSSTSSASSSFLVHSVSDDRTVRSFRVQSDGGWQLLHTHWGHEARVFRLAAAPNGSVVSCGEDDTVRVWTDGQETGVWRERGRKGGVWAVAVDSNSGRVLAGLGDGRVRVVDFSGVLCAHMPQQRPLAGDSTRTTPGLRQRQWELSPSTRVGDDVLAGRLSLPPTEQTAISSANSASAHADEAKQPAAHKAELEYCRALTHDEGDGLFMATSAGRILHTALPLSVEQPDASPPTSRLLFQYPAHLPLNTLSLSSDGRFLAASDSRGGLLLLCLHRTQPSAAPATACWWHSQAVYTTAISFMRFFILSSSTCLMTGDALGEVRWWRVDTTEQSAVRLTEACSFRLPLRTHVTSAVLMQVDATEQNSMRTVAEKEDEGDEEMNAQREECTTAEQLLVCGDSKGSVYVYQLLLSANSLSVYASSRLSAVHNSVSALQAHSSTRLVSVGKDATLLSYSLSSTTDPPSAADAAWIAKHNAALPASSRLPLDARFVLVGTSTTRVGIAQLYGILPPPTAVSSSRPLVYGFSSTELKVHDSERQLQLMSVPCGGSRRPHVCFLSPSSAFAAPALHVVYAAHSAAGCTLSHHALPLQSAVAQADSVGDACHSRLTTAVGLVTLRAASYSTRLLLTTGEDGLFKVWRLSHSDRPHAQLLHTVNDHPDTVRALAVLDGADGSVYAFTGGGRDCLYAYQLRRREAEARETSRAGGEVDVIRSGQTGGANVRMKGKSWLRREQPQHSGEQLDAMDVRILSVVAVANSRSTPTHFSCTVLAGDSVGRLRFFHYAASAFELVASSNSHGRPILCLAACHAVVASGDTVGRMRLWDASTPAAPRELGALQLHQAGVNCCALVAVPSSASYRLTTGGDDGCIAVVSFTVSPAFAVVSRAVHPFMHGSAIRCMRVRAEDGLLLTSGYDQRLRLWRVGEADASVTCVAHTALELADVSGLAVLEEVVAVVGAGLSTLRLSEGAVS